MQFMPGYERITKEIELHGDTDFYSDNYRLSLIVNNLVSNAIKYADPSKNDSFIKITIVVDAKKASITFRDNGIGIEDNYTQKVFNMFFRATTKNEGAGLGLFIVKEAVDKLEGKIDLESKSGEGTVFKIEIPNLVNQQMKKLPVAV
jgi:signal transduction histidine kinase